MPQQRHRASSGNTATGDGVFNGTGVNAKFTMTGGTIKNNTAATGDGGGVFNGTGGTFTMSGGTVSGNKADSGDGGGVYGDGDMTVGGTAQIIGNTKGAGTDSSANNLYLPSGKAVGVGTGDPVAAPAAGMAIGVTLAGGTGSVTSGSTADCSACFC